MGEAVGQSLPLAIGVALSPVPIIAVVLMLTTPRVRANGPAFVVGWLLVAARQFRDRPHQGEEAPLPKWMGAIDRFTPPQALGGGAALAGANPKNLLLAVGGAAAIAKTGIAGGQQAIAYAVVGTLGVGAPVGIYFGMGKRSAEVLGRLKDWMAHNNAVIMAVLCLVIGVKLVGDALGGLTAGG
jgi:Sap, sulfolipid-1-addressing protein